MAHHPRHPRRLAALLINALAIREFWAGAILPTRAMRCGWFAGKARRRASPSL
jgi:hypothetical protein